METENGLAVIGQVPALSLVETHGSPLYVYDGAIIERQITTLRQAFPGLPVGIKYACKALSSLGILRFMQQRGIGLEVVSPQELELGLLAGFAPESITFTPSGVAFSEIEFAVEKGALVNLDNLDVLHRFGQRYGGLQPCFIRFKPNIADGGHEKIMTAHESSKFGIDIRQKDEVLAAVQQYGLKVVGLHQHTGSDIKAAASLLEAAARLFEVATAFPDLQFIDLGGGFKVAYSNHDTTTDMAAFGRDMTAFFQEFCHRYGRRLQLWFEPGKFLVSECGYLLARVNAVKQNPDRSFLTLDTGFNHLVRPMMYGAYHHIVNASRPEAPADTLYDVVGYICETDTFATQRLLPRTQPGDVLAFLNAGAYGYTMASQYNSRLRPPEVLVYEGKARLIRRRDTLADLTAGQLWNE